MTHPDLEWDHRAQRLQFDQLDNFRKTAEQWRNGLAALTGTLTTAAILKGTDTFDELTPDGQTAALVTLGSAMGLLLLSSVLAMRAAFGLPDWILDAGEDLRDWTNSEVKRAHESLRWAKIVTLMALVCLAIGIGTTWVDEAPAAPARVSVTLEDDTALCVVSLQQAGDSFILSLSKKERVVLPQQEVRSIVSGAC